MTGAKDAAIGYVALNGRDVTDVYTVSIGTFNSPTVGDSSSDGTQIQSNSVATVCLNQSLIGKVAVECKINERYTTADSAATDGTAIEEAAIDRAGDEPYAGRIITINRPAVKDIAAN